MVTRETGIVKTFDDQRGFGFITRDNGQTEAFVHFSAIQSGGHRTLVKGEKVAFIVRDTGKLSPEAENVVRI